MTFRLMFVAPFVLGTPFLLAQQPNQPGNLPPQGQPSHQHDHMHRAPAVGTPGRQRADEREQIEDERMDLDELGLPPGEFWLDPHVVVFAGLTPDQVHRLADADLQGTLKLIQLDADLQMDQARLQPMLSAVPVDTGATLAQIDRIADARAAIDKADARLAFALRAVLTADQIAKLQAAPPMPPRQPEFDRDNRPAPPPQM